MSHPDTSQFHRRLRSLIRTAQQLDRHADDLFILGWEPTTGDTEKVAGGNPDRTPRGGNPQARRLYDQIAVNIAQMEAELVGYERAVTRLFYAGSTSPEPTRGYLIRGAEHIQALQQQQRRQQVGEYTPTRLVDQPHNDLGGGR